MCNPISHEFRKLLNKLDLHRPGLSFYAIRHTFATEAGSTRDQVAVNAIMGHADQSMAAVYRERIDDDRLGAMSDSCTRGCGPRRRSERWRSSVFSNGKWLTATLNQLVIMDSKHDQLVSKLEELAAPKFWDDRSVLVHSVLKQARLAAHYHDPQRRVEETGRQRAEKRAFVFVRSYRGECTLPLRTIGLFRLTVFQFRMLFQEFMLEVEGFPQSVFSRVGARYFLPVNFDPGVKDTVQNGTKLSG